MIMERGPKGEKRGEKEENRKHELHGAFGGFVFRE